MAPPTTAPNIRFWSKVNKHGPRVGRLSRCWVWLGGCDRDGYGYFHLTRSRSIRAHRYAWGDVPEGKQVLHRCDNPPCVRRSHLFLGTQEDNQQDMAAKGRAAEQQITQCPAGHLYTEENTYRAPRGDRQCRTCRRASDRRRRAA